MRGQAGAPGRVRWVVDGARTLGARSSGMIEAQDLTKIYGGKAAVDHLSFTVEPGRVTGFLGPNGAGKSTTMRLILGLDRPQSGFALINGRRYRDLKDPLHTVGALLEAKSVHPGRSARNHLLFLAQTQGIPASRVEEVLALVGLQEGRSSGAVRKAVRRTAPGCSRSPAWRHRGSASWPRRRPSCCTS